MRNSILFDLDGTLTDPAEGITNSLRYALEKLEYKNIDALDLTRFIGPPLNEGFTHYCGFTPEQCKLGTQYYREFFGQHGMLQNKLFPEIPALLQTLKNNGKTLYVATSKPLFFAEQILDHFALTPYFAYIGGAGMDKEGGSKAEIVRDVLEKGNISPNDAIMVGDRKHDVLGAQKNGVPTVGVLFGYGDEAEHKAAGASHIAHTIPKLQEILLRPDL